MHTFDNTEYATTQELAAAVGASLALPQGLVSAEEIEHWRAGLAAKGWQLDARRRQHLAVRHHTTMRHRASGLRADVRVLPYDPARPQYPIVGDTAREDLRYAVASLRISSPAEGTLRTTRV